MVHPTLASHLAMALETFTRMLVVKEQRGLRIPGTHPFVRNDREDYQPNLRS